MKVSAATLGVSVVARNVSILQGVVSGVLRGVQIQQELARVSMVEATDCTEGFYAAAGGSPTLGDDVEFSACLATACSRGFRSNRPRTEAIGCVSKLCGTSYYADAGGAGMRVTGGKSVSPTTAHLNGTITQTALLMV